MRLAHWEPRIKKTTYINELEFKTSGEGGEFTVIARWDGGEHSIEFTRQKVLGRSLTSPQPYPVKRACIFRDDIIREVLQERMGR